MDTGTILYGGVMTTNRITPSSLRRLKKAGTPIVALTAYDYITATLLDSAGVDVILVGDSVGMVVMGLSDTVGVKMESMIYHTSLVARGVRHALVVADLPFLSYHCSTSQALENAGRLLQDGGCFAVKLEGFRPELIRTMVDAGIPVMGHIGLTPQSYRLSGTYRISGRRQHEREDIIEQAKILEEAGCFSLVLEAMTPEPAREISELLSIPTIGIGAGPGCDGQILVLHDLVGLTTGEAPKFVRRYASVAGDISRAVTAYADDVRSRRFPSTEETYSEN